MFTWQITYVWHMSYIYWHMSNTDRNSSVPVTCHRQFGHHLSRTIRMSFVAGSNRYCKGLKPHLKNSYNPISGATWAAATATQSHLLAMLPHLVAVAWVITTLVLYHHDMLPYVSLAGLARTSGKTRTRVTRSPIWSRMSSLCSTASGSPSARSCSKVG